MLQPSQLLTLRAVLAVGSFASAAEALNYTPSAVSQQIAALEKASGLVLFERSAHSVSPTAHARELAARSADLLSLLDTLDRDVSALARGESGQLRIGSFPTASARLLPPALAALSSARPGVDIAVDEGEVATLLPRLENGELDVAIVYRYRSVPTGWPASLVETPLLSERLWVLLPTEHRLAGELSVRFAALRQDRWVAPLADSPGALNLDRLAAAAGFTPRVSFRSNDYSVVRGLVAAGLGVAVVPGLALSESPGLVVKKLAGRAMRRDVLALHRPHGRNALIEAALDAMRTTAAGLS
jgi:DNA-binding transcriptional LysR family regulator